ncbi:MAG: Maf family protein, partial [Solobacterium sp.]|nr:Maf family protein [Solobacterium sp.]
MKRIILASQSPRRKELLEKCGVSFTVEAADIDESINPDNDLKEEIRKLAYRKAHAVLVQHPDAVVIGSDTIVVLNGEVLGKPHDRKDAERMLRELSGHTHQVITGICFAGSGKTYTDVSVS